MDIYGNIREMRRINVAVRNSIAKAKQSPERNRLLGLLDEQEKIMGLLAQGWAVDQANQQALQTTNQQQAATITTDAAQITTLQQQLAAAGQAATLITDPADVSAAQAIIALAPASPAGT